MGSKRKRHRGKLSRPIVVPFPSCSKIERMEQTCACGICGLVPLVPRLRRTHRVIAESEAMQDLLKKVAQFSQSEAPVAVLGETGTGKEVVARVLHANSSRGSKPFVAVNVAALPAELLESELFGHSKGAFTGAAAPRRGLFEEADGGTLFLDEIGEMPLSLQAKLLRALQDGEVRRVGESRPFAVDLRIVCATHCPLDERVRSGQFREDLYFRLKVLTLRVPPLRERRADILPLASEFLREERTQAVDFAEDARRKLLEHAWPGNVRELQNAVKHGAALAAQREVRAKDLPEDNLEPRPHTRAIPASSSHDLRPLADVEREHVLKVLDVCGGSQAEAARVLGIARNTLWRKLKGYA